MRVGIFIKTDFEYFNKSLFNNKNPQTLSKHMVGLKRSEKLWSSNKSNDWRGPQNRNEMS
jgi:hypothetical protein